MNLTSELDDLRAIQLRELRSRIDQGLASVDKGADGEGFMQNMLDDLDSREVVAAILRRTSL